MVIADDPLHIVDDQGARLGLRFAAAKNGALLLRRLVRLVRPTIMESVKFRAQAAVVVRMNDPKRYQITSPERRLTE
jgi:hypothetical protein